MNLPDIALLAQQATAHLRPELLLLAGKAAEGTATESGKQIFAWFQNRLRGKAAEAALEDAAAHPENELRISALQTQIAILIEDNEAFRQELAALLAGQEKEVSAEQNASARGTGNKIGQVSGNNSKVSIR